MGKLLCGAEVGALGAAPPDHPCPPGVPLATGSPQGSCEHFPPGAERWGVAGGRAEASLVLTAHALGFESFPVGIGVIDKKKSKEALTVASVDPGITTGSGCWPG